MAANLQGIRFDQIYGDNSGTLDGQRPYDSDHDGTATQEDEFVSIANSSEKPMDVSGWQIWSDSTGSGAPDAPQDGLYHTFPPGSVLQPGETLYIINEISGKPPPWAQEASRGGSESDEGGKSTNFLTEGDSGKSSEAVALVNPSSGEYIVFNMAPGRPEVQEQRGFPGTRNVGTEDGTEKMPDQWAGASYRYDSRTDSYRPCQVSTPCFASGTWIATPAGPVAVERLRVGDRISTLDAGAMCIRWIGLRRLHGSALARGGQHPVEFAAGSLGGGLPRRALRVSPQHRMLLPGGVLAPARGLVGMPGVRTVTECSRVEYRHLLLASHQIIHAEGAATESLLPGPTFLAGCPVSERLRILAVCGPDRTPARQILTVAQARACVCALAVH